VYQNSLVEWFRKRSHEPGVAEALERYGDALVLLWYLDLQPALQILLACYAKRPRGSKPRHPLILLRCLLLMIVVGQPSINKWVKDLKGNRILRALVGCCILAAPSDPVPT